jgi:hypothetical protein
MVREQEYNEVGLLVEEIDEPERFRVLELESDEDEDVLDTVSMMNRSVRRSRPRWDDDYR